MYEVLFWLKKPFKIVIMGRSLFQGGGGVGQEVAEVEERSGSRVRARK
jgi:hypothetical protein